MKFPSLPLSAQDILGVIVPGAVGAWIIFALFREFTVAQAFIDLSKEGQWTAFTLAALILGLLSQPLSHPLNRLYDGTYRRWRRRYGDPHLDFATKEAEKYLPNLHLRHSIYEWAKTEVEKEDKTIGQQIGRLQGFSKLCRSLSLYLLIGAAVLAFYQKWVLSLICIAIFFPSIIVFFQQRYAATCLVYQRFYAIRHSSRLMGSQKARRRTPS
jgi:hypothetical protein